MSTWLVESGEMHSPVTYVTFADACTAVAQDMIERVGSLIETTRAPNLTNMEHRELTAEIVGLLNAHDLVWAMNENESFEIYVPETGVTYKVTKRIN